jgi:glycosyltransferase involved in cell wall biosynthesis
MKVLVTQLGARRHYLVPAALQQAGCLQRFATDYYSKGLTARLAKVFPPPIATRAEARSTPDLPSEKVAAFPAFALSNALSIKLQRGVEGPSRRWIRIGEQFARLCRRHLRSDTTHVYAFTSAAHELFSAAKASGALCILDHATAPRKNEMKLVHEEHKRFPDWATQEKTDAFIERYHQRQIEEARMADIVICNSTFARRTLLAAGVSPETVAVVPLGVRLPAITSPLRRTRDSRGRLRVLYVGGEALRKGVPYLVEALSMLGALSIEARFVGDLALSAHGVREVQRVGHVFGGVPRNQMDQHFDWADVLVLPSVSDTFGLVMIEAMARGIPVIASDHTGAPDVLRDRIDGFVVPIRDSLAIAAKLDELASQPQILSDMSRSAAQRAVSFSLSAYRERLISATRKRPNLDVQTIAHGS